MNKKPKAKRKKKRFVIGRDFDSWAIKYKDTGEFRLSDHRISTYCLSLLFKLKPPVESDEIAVRVKFVEVE